jgi:DNA-directed RNA polymerase subunit RPC12/RpoP
MRAQTSLLPTPPRKPPQKLMHVIDAGANPYVGPPNMIAKFKCARCGRASDWIPIGLTEAKRGIPCPTCNASQFPSAGR